MNKTIKFLCLSALLTGNASFAMDLGYAYSADAAESLCLYAAVGDLKMVKDLLDAGVPVNVKPKDLKGRTPLMSAACHGRRDICQLLLDRKAQIDVRNDSGWTPLIFAANNGHKKVCFMLVEGMLKPIKENQAAAIALLAIKKSRKSACMNIVDNHMIRLIAHQVFDAEKQRLFAQINEIQGVCMREFVRIYAHQQLKIDPKTTQGTSHE
jgi:hypothetical protein